MDKRDWKLTTFNQMYYGDVSPPDQFDLEGLYQGTNIHRLGQGCRLSMNKSIKPSPVEDDTPPQVLKTQDPNKWTNIKITSITWTHLLFKNDMTLYMVSNAPVQQNRPPVIILSIWRCFMFFGWRLYKRKKCKKVALIVLLVVFCLFWNQ